MASAPDPYAGLNPDFATRLRALVAASGGRITLTSGYRSVAQQTALWNQALAKYGSAAEARKWVAPPGASNHNRGMAMDLGGDLNLAHQLAPSFGLAFALGNEPWHVEPAGLRSNPNTDPRAYSPNGGQSGGFDDQLAQFMRGVRTEESGGNYTARNSIGAGGAYQFMPDTWRANAGPYARQYSEAWMAPPAVQDEVARRTMQGLYQQFGGDWSKVAMAWLEGAGAVMKGQNNSDGAIRAQDYARKVLTYAGLDSAGAPAAGTELAPAAGEDRRDPGVQLQSFLSIISNPADLPPTEAPEAA